MGILMYFDAIAVRVVEPQGPGVVAVELRGHFDGVVQPLTEQLLIKGVDVVHHKGKMGLAELRRVIRVIHVGVHLVEKLNEITVHPLEIYDPADIL